MTEVKQKLQKFREYLDYIETHYDNVQKAWDLIKKECKGKGFRFMDDDFVYHSIEQKIAEHDLSKFSAGEFTHYRRHFYPVEGESKNELSFLIASGHHIKYNYHHWQRWTNSCAALQSPYADIYVVDMVVDWVAMGFEDSFDTAKVFYKKNKGEIFLPKWAEELMYSIFDEIYVKTKE